MKTFDIDDPGLEFIQGIRRCGAFVYRVNISEGEKKMKTFDKKDVYSWSNAEDAKQYIGEEGYFSDELKKNLKFWVKGTLKVINTDLKVSEVFAKENEEGDYPYGLFLPAKKVKEVEEKKWRAFKDSKEFIHTIKAYLGDSITFRYKEENEGNSSALITGFSKELYVTFGGRSYSYEQLFYYLEWFDGNTWHPFGVLENE